LFERYGVENCQILLIENVCCDNINELTSREGYFIRTLHFINKNIPLRTQKKYHEDNREKITEQRKVLHKEFYNNG
jgi:ribosome-interacting GTPase 1